MSGVVLTQADTSPFLPQACLHANKQFTFGAVPPPWGMLPETFTYGFRDPKSKSKNALQSNGHVGTWFGAATNNVVCGNGVLQADHGSRRWICIRFFQIRCWHGAATAVVEHSRSIESLRSYQLGMALAIRGRTLCFQTPRYQYVSFSFSARSNLLGPLLIFVTWWIGSWPWIHASGCFQLISEAEKCILNKCQHVRPSDGRHVFLDRVHDTWCTPSTGHPNSGTTIYRLVSNQLYVPKLYTRFFPRRQRL